MSKAARLAWAFLLVAGPAQAKDFTFDEKVNQEMARRLKIPVYFAVPNSARGALPKSIETSDRLIDFKHPDAKRGDVGLRLVVAKRAGLAQRLGKSGLVQTGDLLLTFRAEWGGAGAYPNVQMGISHTGIAYIKDGVLHNIDNPLNRGVPGRSRRAQQRALPHPVVHSCHSPAQPDGCAARQPARVDEPARRQLGARLSQADQLQPGLQRAEVQARQVAGVRQAPGPDRARAEPARHGRHVLLGVRLVAAVAEGLRSGQSRRRLQGQPHPVVRARADEADERDGRLHHAPRALFLRRPDRRAAAGGGLAEAARPRRRKSCCTRCSSTVPAVWRSCRPGTRRWRSR